MTETIISGTKLEGMATQSLQGYNSVRFWHNGVEILANVFKIKFLIGGHFDK